MPPKRREAVACASAGAFLGGFIAILLLLAGVGVVIASVSGIAITFAMAAVGGKRGLGCSLVFVLVGWPLLLLAAGGLWKVHVEHPARAIFVRCDHRLDARRILGLTEGVANADAVRSGCRMRVEVNNGQELEVTSDFESNRIDVAVEHGVVVKITHIG